jgi:hypothetical protein
MRKFWLVLTGAILTLTIIACSCGSLIPTPTPTIPPQPTFPPAPTVAPNPMPELAGYWEDTETKDVHVIEWQDGKYVVTAINAPDGSSLEITDQSWDGSSLNWTYYVSGTGVSVTFTTVSVSGDNLYTNWSNTDDRNGTETLVRVSSPIPVQSSSSQEPMPGLAGKWLDPDTTGTYSVIAWQNGEYVVIETANPNRGGNEVTSSDWSNGVLTWTYCVQNGACVTTKTISVSGDNLYTTWFNDQGYDGSTTMVRQP